ncbi:MAG: FAD-dependent oxidoreductase [Maricaulaceae bacterium]|nr:FAD-dependent oxidoreductase [Maricaulaceae bacterium]
MADFTHDVVIVGAGYSGLRAAQLLAGDFRVRLVEARARPGGRALLHRFGNGDEVDLGGQWAGPGQDRLYALAAAHGAAVYPLWDEGDRLVADGDRLRRYRGTIPKLPLPVLLDLHGMMSAFEGMAKTIDTLRPWAHPKAQEWDHITVAEWMARKGRTRGARAMFAVGIGAVFAAEAHEISLLHGLFYARSGGSLDRLLSVSGGAQQDRLHGGIAGLAQKMAASLPEGVPGYDEPVSRIEWSDDGVTVKTAKTAYRARRAILALPPGQALRIAFSPALPGPRDALWRRMPAGACIKCVAQYQRPFWRDQGLAGQAVAGDGVVRVAFDNTEAGKDTGLLLGFVEGDQARYWSGRDPEKRKQAVLAGFARFFGPQALEPMDYADQDWTAEEFTRGCYAALMGPGVWTSLGQHLRAPFGAVHVAGTETASEWYGYFEGALQAAERAADEARAALKG